MMGLHAPHCGVACSALRMSFFRSATITYVPFWSSHGDFPRLGWCEVNDGVVSDGSKNEAHADPG